MIPFHRFYQRFQGYLKDTPSETLYRQGLYWGVMVIAGLIVGLTSYHFQALPSKLTEAIHTTVSHRPWIRDLVVVDGRQVYLRGDIEFVSGIEPEIALIKKIPGVSEVVNLLNETPKPSAYLRIRHNAEALVLEGQLPGEVLETVVDHIQTVFPGIKIQDRIQIDDRLARPLWMDGIAQSLYRLTPLEAFDFNGWQDQILLTGTASTERQGRQIGYAIPASLIDSVTVTNRLTTKTAHNLPSFIMVSDWSGVWLEGNLPSEEIAEQLIEATESAFGTKDINHSLTIDPLLISRGKLDSLIRFLPELGNVRDLRLETSGNHYVLWGRVDDARQLGRILQQRNKIGLDDSVQNEVIVSAANKAASISLFSDGHRAVLSGLLPTRKIYHDLSEQVKSGLNVDEIKNLVSIEPNIAHSEWLRKWPDIIALLPEGVTGITIDDQSLLLTGQVESDSKRQQIDDTMEQLFPDKNHLNWITLSESTQ